MKSVLVSALILTGFLFVARSQEKHTTPDHPKGDISSQLEALQYYNEACELYKYGQIEDAKHSLFTAINSSFELTEAQLFLGYIYYKENKLDSAFLYLNSGIDFSIDQLPHFYFMAFETGMIVGEYELVKQNVKHFTKLYGKKSDLEPYEVGYCHTIVDFEYYQKSMDLIYNYKSWIPKATLSDTLIQCDYTLPAFYLQQDDLVIVENNSATVFKNSKSYHKKKQTKIAMDQAHDFYTSASGDYLFFCLNRDEKTDIYFAKKSGKNWLQPILLNGDVNSASWDGNPYYSEKDSLLYFSSNRSGNKDLYVTKINLSDGTCSKAEALYRVNTAKDEMNPCWHNGVFYFSSNGHPGFGGFDIFSTPEFQEYNGLVYPINFYNLNYPVNTNEDELKLLIAPNNYDGFLLRANYLHQAKIIRADMIQPKQKIDFEIQMFKISG
jgi:hypothetical protein